MLYNYVHLKHSHYKSAAHPTRPLEKVLQSNLVIEVPMAKQIDAAPGSTAGAWTNHEKAARGILSEHLEVGSHGLQELINGNAVRKCVQVGSVVQKLLQEERLVVGRSGDQRLGDLDVVRHIWS
mmetsp:Transcript_30369/g.48649  ORF Transcript_30369/g.48649 Transcript_30369/m.48649 type:complete len:124 (+) Transcript_30369:100-471(+)